jgi:DnaJ like chaperone protein
MGKYAKWIGGGLGWALGGPIGGILGFVFGSVVDGIQTIEVQTLNRPGTTQYGDFSASLLVLSAAVMKADGKVLKSELDYVRNFFSRQFHEDEVQDKMYVLREILKQEIRVDEVCIQIRQFMNYSDRLQLLHYLFGISNADGAVNEQELSMIELISRYLGLYTADFESIKAMFVKDVDSAFKILEIEPVATDDEVKKAYRRMAMKYHPDKVSHLGEDVQKAAHEKFQTVNKAYEDIKKKRGMN